MLPLRSLLPLLETLRHRALPLLAVLTLVLFGSACRRYEVIQQSGPPSALQGVNNIAVTYDYSQIAISDKRMSEAQWLETREKDEHRNTYLETKDSANTGVVTGLTSKLGGVTVTAGEAAPGAIQATVVYEEWEEGMYAAVVAWPSKITARIVFSIDGQVLDEIRVRTQETASIYTPAPQQRLHTCGKRLGEVTAEYILSVNK
jgi:hypothetical protein